ncbi:MAG TPA: pitrilysin family protein, partial [Rariglobus sp.]|nr:pitrilysin family protein [Rariglobus sp.]
MNLFHLFRPLAIGLLIVATGLHAQIAEHAIRTRIAGLDVIAYPTGVKDVVTFCGSLPAGDSFAPSENLAVPTLVGAMLDKGTTTEDKYAIAQKLDSVGAELGFEVGGTLMEFSGKCLRKDLPMVIGLLAEELRSPAFSEEEFAKVKQQLTGELQRALESTGYRAGQTFADAIYQPGSPNYQPPTEAFLAAIKTATVADLRAFHKKYYGPAAFTVVAVGDLDVPDLQSEIAKSFAGWTGGVAKPDYPKPAPVDADRDQSIFMPDKPSVSVILGQPSGLKYTDPDSMPLRVATTILGSGFTGRLMATVRDKEGLTYGIGSRVSNDAFAEGDWRISASFAPSLLEKGLASTRRELKKWYDDGVTAAELERTKTNLTGSYKVGLATTDGIAGMILATIARGYDLNWLDEYPKKIDAVTLDQVNA